MVLKFECFKINSKANFTVQMFYLNSVSSACLHAVFSFNMNLVGWELSKK